MNKFINMKTIKLRGIDSSAHCRDCGWSDSGSGDDSSKLTSKARYHAQQDGHEVEVYREHGIVIKPL